MDANHKNMEPYLFGALPEAERSAFEAEMDADPQLAETVAVQRAEQLVQVELLQDELRAQLQNWRSERAEAEKKRGLMGVSWLNVPNLMRVAAIFVVALVAWKMMAPSNPFAAGDYLPENYNIAKGPGSQEQTIAAAEKLMSEKFYQQALQKLEVEKLPDFSELIHLLRGKCFFRMGQFPAAEAEFSQLTNPQTAAQNRNEARFCLMLTACATGDWAKAKQLRDGLRADGGAFKDDAEGLKDAF